MFHVTIEKPVCRQAGNKYKHMKLLIFKTNIGTKRKISAVKPIFNNHSTIKNWSIDTEDIDNVLRIEAVGQLDESDVIDLMRKRGFRCEVLLD